MVETYPFSPADPDATSQGVSVDTSGSYTPRGGGYAYRWGEFESEQQQQQRMARFAKTIALAPEYAGQSVLLVSHGGPSSGLHRTLMKVPEHEKSPSCGFTGLYIYRYVGTGEHEQEQEHGSGGLGGEWQSLLVADFSHLAEVGVGTVIGHNDVAEQDK
jgi:broad specificity phosphatase PhoE